MKTLKGYITEKLKVTRKASKKHMPDSLEELKKIIEARVDNGSGTLDCTDIDVSLIEDFSRVFDFGKTYKFDTIDITGWDTSNAKKMGGMFRFCRSITDIIGLEDLNVSDVKEFDSMFYACTSLKECDLSKWDMSNCEDCSYMFSTCEALNEVKGIEKLRMPKCTNIAYMFSQCVNLKSVDIYNIGVRNQCNASGMFYGCKNIETIRMKGFNFKRCEEMFTVCKNLTKLVLDNIDMSNVHSISHMFEACRNLETIEGNIENWDISRAAFAQETFCNCEKLKLDLSGWDISNLQLTSKMFYNAPGIKKPRKKK